MVDDLDETPLLLALLRATQVVDRRMAPLIDELGVTPEQWRVLSVLAGAGGLPMTDLSRLAVLPPATTTRIVDKLISTAMVYRRADLLDRRRIMVFLSPHGKTALGGIEERRREVERELAREVGSRRFLGFADGLTHVAALGGPSADDDRTAADTAETTR